jgi:hypothetical protein
MRSVESVTPTTQDEDVARSIMSRVLAVPVEHYDDGSRTRMHDFAFTLPDGRTGAAEMTSVNRPGRSRVAWRDALSADRCRYHVVVRCAIEAVEWLRTAGIDVFVSDHD